jgi:hypothetical protein
MKAVIVDDSQLTGALNIFEKIKFEMRQERYKTAAEIIKLRPG